MADASDRELLVAWRRGDSSAGNQLVRRHFGPLYKFFVTRVGAEAEDMCQQTLMVCVQAKDNIWEQSGVRAYLFGVARKILLNYNRKQARRKAAPNAAAPRSFTSPSRAAAGREHKQLLLAALRRLPLDQQIALELFYWEDMAVAEVAHVLEVPDGTIKARLSRARDRLRKEIEGMDASDHLRTQTIEQLEHWTRAVRDELDLPE